MTSKEFEEKVGWIITLLEGSRAEVQIDERMPDPDNPKQNRQIDIKIKRADLITLVECRIHKKPQNVKWIEELIGRRISLNASSVIAVSASGYTEGAIKKADRFGIILRDFRSLSEEEVVNWGIASKVYLEYVTFFNTTLFIIFEPQPITRKLMTNFSFVTPDDKPWPIDSIFRKAMNEADTRGKKKGGIKFEVFTKQLLFRGSQINEIIFQSNYDTIRLPVELPLVFVYGNPNIKINPDMFIEGQSSSKFEIYRNKSQSFVIADLSVVGSIRSSIFKAILFDFQVPVSLNGIKIIGEDEKSKYLIPFETIEIQKDSIEYDGLKSSFS